MEYIEIETTNLVENDQKNGIVSFLPTKLMIWGFFAKFLYEALRELKQPLSH